MPYDELVKRLRKLSGLDNLSEFDEAADAIEELQADKAALNGAVTNLLEQIKDHGKPRWIPVTERLPEDECPVLVTYLGFHDHKPRANMLAYIDRDLGWCWWDDDIPGGVPCSVEITHWQPLPEPPKEK